MDSKTYMQFGVAMIEGFTEGVKTANEAITGFARAYVKGMTRPLNKARHYHLYSKKARTRKKYAKMYEFAQRNLHYLRGAGTHDEAI